MIVARMEEPAAKLDLEVIGSNPILSPPSRTLLQHIAEQAGDNDPPSATHED